MQIKGERLVHREIVLQGDVDAQVGALGRFGDELDDLALDQRTEQLPGAFAVLFFGLGRFVAIAQQPLHGAAAVAFAAEDVEQHAVGNLEARGQPFRRARG